MKQYTVTWSPESIQDLENTYERVYQQSPQGADIVVDTLYDLGNTLKTTPNAHRLEPSLKGNVYRFIPKWDYKIIYEVREDEHLVYIARVHNTLRHPRKLSV